MVVITNPGPTLDPSAPKKVKKKVNNAQKVGELKSRLKEFEARKKDGKDLVAFYLNGARTDGSGDTRLPVAYPKVTGSTVLPLDQGSLAKNKVWAVYTAVYLDAMFPKGGSSSGNTTVNFYTSSPTGPVLSGNNPIYPPTKRKDMITTSGSFWENKLKGKSLRQRVTLLRQTITSINASIKTTKNEIVRLGGSLDDTKPKTGGGDNGGDTGQTTKNNYDNKPIEYNVGMVNEAYFSPKPQWQELVNSRGGNKPEKVEDALKLWSGARHNKGMIWLYSQGPDTLSVEPSNQTPKKDTKKRYAFQFHYNPTSIDMAWQGSPEVDITMETSGLETYNLINGQTMSNITFSIILNRMFDMQYYGSDGQLKPGRRGDKNPYAPMQPDKATQKRIYNYGTMYDVEYLLSTVLGFKLDTRFRGSTSDVGFLTGRPVDVYLGNRLRYWGYINSVSLTHQFFDERMVPTFSVLSITLNRIPDYQE